MTNMKVFLLIFVLCLAILAACSEDSERPIVDCNHPSIEAIVLMQNDPLCFDSHADIQITVSDGATEYVLLELMFDRGEPYNIPHSDMMTFACVESLQVDFMCYSDQVWTRSEGSLKIPVLCGEFVYIGVYADTINPLSTYKGFVAFELEEEFKCEEVESLYIAWGSISD